MEEEPHIKKSRSRVCNIPTSGNNIADVDEAELYNFDNLLDEKYSIKYKKNEQPCAANIVFAVIPKSEEFKTFSEFKKFTGNIVNKHKEHEEYEEYNPNEIIPGKYYKHCLPYEFIKNRMKNQMKIPNFKIKKSSIKYDSDVKDYKIVIRFRPSDSITTQHIKHSGDVGGGQLNHPIRIITTIFGTDKNVITRWISTDFVSVKRLDRGQVTEIFNSKQVPYETEIKNGCDQWETTSGENKHPATDNDNLYTKDNKLITKIVNDEILENKGLVIYALTKNPLQAWVKNEYIRLFETQGDGLTRKNYFLFIINLEPICDIISIATVPFYRTVDYIEEEDVMGGEEEKTTADILSEMGEKTALSEMGEKTAAAEILSKMNLKRTSTEADLSERPKDGRKSMRKSIRRKSMRKSIRRKSIRRKSIRRKSIRKRRN